MGRASTAAGAADELERRLGLPDAVVIGLGAMLGAGIFAAPGPAAHAAGSALPAGLAVAAVVAYCNATSSARLAARYPASGGTYVYGRERLGAFWGYLAGRAFVVGKTASCAAMALTLGAYVWPAHAHAVAVTGVVAVTAVDYAGVRKSAWVTGAIVVLVLAVLTAVVAVALTSGAASPTQVQGGPRASFSGVLQAGGLLFFAFAGYARIATLGEEVRDPRAVRLALGTTVVVYALVAACALTVLGPSRLAEASAPLVETVRAAGAGRLAPVVRAGAAVTSVSPVSVARPAAHQPLSLRGEGGPGTGRAVLQEAPPRRTSGTADPRAWHVAADAEGTPDRRAGRREPPTAVVTAAIPQSTGSEETQSLRTLVRE
ncbi:APC family permease [Streptomyces sp. NPDC006743]|uniref:APC family permease n=1 Tax=Streptomyces sp. NPDC006743 TaxID=3154480 RepID=UPI003451B7E8